MKTISAHLLAVLLSLAVSHIVYAGTGRPAKASGPLRVHPTNPRYFTDGTKNADGSLKAVYLTGSHTWNNLIDMDKADPPAPFDFAAYLDFLQRYGHNFIRLWAWDSVAWDSRANGKLGKDFVHHVAPLPWARTGPGNALDGKPKFDLTKFNPEYFDRLRTRVRAAGERGIYVSVMLFEGWGLSHANRRVPAADGWAYRSHPFHPDNNINGITGDLNGDGNVLEIHSLASDAITALQAAYIRKVVDTVNDLDNVLYEVINEGGNQEWDWWVVKTVKDHERTKSQAASGRHHGTRRREDRHHAGQPGGLDLTRQSGRLPRPRARVGRPQSQSPGHRSHLGRRRQSWLGLAELPARAQSHFHGPLRRLNPG